MSGFRPTRSKAYEAPLRVRRHKIAPVVIDEDMSAAEYILTVADCYEAEQVRVLEDFLNELKQAGEKRGRLVFEMPSGMFGICDVTAEGER